MFWRKKTTTAAANNINTVEDTNTEDDNNTEDFNDAQLQQHPQVLLKSSHNNLCAAMTYSISRSI